MDLPSESDESDVDFVPEGEESSDVPSENDDILENENGKGVLAKKGKRPAAGSKKHTKSKRHRKDSEEECANVEKEEIKSINTEVDKKSEDDLWASFLTPEVKKTEVEPTASTNSNEMEKDKSVSDNLNHIKTDKNKLFGNRPISAPKSGGLSSILNKIGKANKLSTLEKSKMDWNNFKKDQDIEEEISTHNRGRAGYLERQDFLQRTDLRQFEIEKNLRTNKRSNR